MIRPFGSPPSPNAISRLRDPVGTVSTFIFAELSPSFITDPLPYCLSICAIAASSAFNLSSFAIIFSFLSNLCSYLCSNSSIFCLYCQCKILNGEIKKDSRSATAFYYTLYPTTRQEVFSGNPQSHPASVTLPSSSETFHLS